MTEVAPAAELSSVADCLRLNAPQESQKFRRKGTKSFKAAQCFDFQLQPQRRQFYKNTSYGLFKGTGVLWHDVGIAGNL